ncbi:MAG: thioesterase family protein, partial [Gaiellales bacterium]
DIERIEFAVIGIELRYRAPLQFDDVFHLHAGLSEVRRARFSLSYLIERDGVPVLDGRTHHAALELGTHRPVRVPAWLAGALVAS